MEKVSCIYCSGVRIWFHRFRISLHETRILIKNFFNPSFWKNEEMKPFGIKYQNVVNSQNELWKKLIGTKDVIFSLTYPFLHHRQFFDGCTVSKARRIWWNSFFRANFHFHQHLLFIKKWKVQKNVYEPWKL